jgi:hypothetical protein
MDTTGELLTEREAADRLLMKPQTLTKWRCRKRGPRYVRLGGKVRYRAGDVQAFIDAGVVDPGQPRARKKRAGR